MRDLANHLNFRRAIAPAAAVSDNTPLVGQVIDVAGFSSVVFVIQAGALTDADATFAALVEDSDNADFSASAAVDAAKLTGTAAQAGLTFADDNAVRKIGYVGSKRYVRLTVTPANNTGSAFISALAVLGDARYGATTNPPA